MGVTIRKDRGKWYLFVNHEGRRKAKCIGSSRQAAEQAKRLIEAKLALGEPGFPAAALDVPAPTFGDYADRWLDEYARIECKTSTANGYRSILDQYLRPRFGKQRIDTIKPRP